MCDLSELELVKNAKNGSSEAYDKLFAKYFPRIKSEARKYFLIGYDLEDILQESMFGFLRAISTYDENKQASFSSYAFLCVKRTILDLIKKNNSQKICKDTVDISYQGAVQAKNEKMFILPASEPLPDEDLIQKESLSEIFEFAKQHFSTMEQLVFHFYLEGLSYKQIAKKLNKNEASVENALTRLRKKLTEKFK